MSDSVRPHRRQATRLPRPWDFPGKNTGVGCHFLLQCMNVWQVKVKSLSHVRLLETPWTAAHQAPLSRGFSRQEYWSGLPLPSPKSAQKMTNKQWLQDNRACSRPKGAGEGWRVTRLHRGGMSTWAGVYRRKVREAGRSQNKGMKCGQMGMHDAPGGREVLQRAISGVGVARGKATEQGGTRALRTMRWSLSAFCRQQATPEGC